MDKFICLVFSLYWIGNTFEMHILNWNLKLFWKNCEERRGVKQNWWQKSCAKTLKIYQKLLQWGINHSCLNTGVEKGEFYLVFAQLRCWNQYWKDWISSTFQFFLTLRGGGQKLWICLGRYEYVRKDCMKIMRNKDLWKTLFNATWSSFSSCVWRH